MDSHILFSVLGGTSMACIAGLLGYVAWKSRPVKAGDSPELLSPVAGFDEGAGVSSAPLSGFCLDRYTAMERLLSDEDLRYLKTRPGFRPAMAQNWQREQRRIFRMYLADLKSDFAALHAEARSMVASAGVESAPLVELLMRQNLTFWKACAALELRLLLREAGIGQVSVKPFLDAVESMRVDLVRAAAPQTA